MMFWLGPSLTKNVAATEPTMHTAPTTSGKVIISSWAGPVNRIEPSSMVATMVTA